MPIFFTIVVLYFLLFFIIARFIIPGLGFWEGKIPDKISRGMQQKIAELKALSTSPSDFLNLTYDFLGGKYHAERLKTILKFNYLFMPLETIWLREGYLPCTQISYMTKIFLVKSGYFKEAEVRRKHTFVNFVLHQYLQVKIAGRWIDVDTGEKQRSLPIGKHLKFFG